MTVFVSNLEEDTAKKSLKLGEEKMGRLVKKLSEAGRQEDILKSVDDPEYRKKLYEEFSIGNTPDTCKTQENT